MECGREEKKCLFKVFNPQVPLVEKGATSIDIVIAS